MVYQQDLWESLNNCWNLTSKSSAQSCPPANIKPLKIKLKYDALPVKVRLRNYSQAQREFFQDFVENLERTGLAYWKQTEKWARTPLIVSKSGPGWFRFTVDLRPVKKFTDRHNFPMPNIEQWLGKLAIARYFANFDLLYGYWKLPIETSSQ